MRSITIRRLKPKVDLSPMAQEVECEIREREVEQTSRHTLKGAALGIWYAKLNGPTIMWVAVHGQVETRYLEEEGLTVVGYTHKGKYVAYGIVGHSLTPEQQIAFLKGRGISVADNGLFTMQSLEQVENYLTVVQRRLYATSLIVCDPKQDCRATFRATTDVMTTTVSGVSWNLDRHGFLIPRLMVVPITMKGALISNVSGHNAAFILNEGIGVGATVRIRYEIGAIPIVDEVIGRADPDLPSEPYKWEELHVRPTDKQLRVQ